MDRGQSTIEVAIVFPVAIIMLWWALGAPLAGLRAVAARSAVAACVRTAVVEDQPSAVAVGRAIQGGWTSLAGEGQKRVEVAVAPGRLTVRAGEGDRRLIGIADFQLEFPRETD